MERSGVPSTAVNDVAIRLRAAGCVFAEEEAALLVAAATTSADLAALVDQRLAGLPLEHILGWAEFCGLRVVVNKGVFVPRRRTEFLVQQAATLLGVSAGNGRSSAVVVDMCCGSGAVGAAIGALAGEREHQIELHAADIDPAAVRCARRNLAAVGQVYQGDLYDALPTTLRGRVHVLVANVPYVPTDAVEMMPPEARLHEARVALDGGPDGLDAVRRLVAEAPRWLAPGAHVLFETSQRQAPQAIVAAAGAGLIARVVSSDQLAATVVVGTRPELKRDNSC